MTQEQIKDAVDKKYREMEECAFCETFVLNSDLVRLKKEVTELQKECNHKFENGKCIYCRKKEEKKND